MWRHFSTVPGEHPPLFVAQPVELLPLVGEDPGSGPVELAVGTATPPDLVGMWLRDARRLAGGSGWHLHVEERPVSEGLWDRVLHQSPADDPGIIDRVLTLTVGARPHVTVPDVRGRGEDEARSILHEAGLGAVRRATRRSDRVPEGHVVRTRPRAGAEVPAGSRVSLVLATSRPERRSSRHGDRHRIRQSRLPASSFLSFPGE